MAKMQLPTIGGIRKVLYTAAAQSAGTTIAGLEGQTVTIEQLAAAIFNLLTNTGTIDTASNAPGVLVPGPGLAGGGVLVGNVPIRLTAPIPWTDEGSNVEDAMIVPGLPGARGAQGVPGQFLMPEDGADGDWGPPGAAGAIGATGAVGATGPQGPAGSGTGSGGTGVLLMMIPEDGQDGDWTPAPPGPAGATGARGLQGIQGQFLLPEDGADGDWGPPGPPGVQGPAGTGSTGSVGPSGAQGVAIFLDGDQGNDGDWGPPGIAGAAGSTGATGSTGSIGPIGPQGVAIFLEAEPGEQGDWTPGPQGPAGAVGATGPQGPSGTGSGGGAGNLMMFIPDDNIPSDEIQVAIPASVGPLIATSLYVKGVTTGTSDLYLTGGGIGVPTSIIFPNSNDPVIICSGPSGVLKVAAPSAVDIQSNNTIIAVFNQSAGISFSATAAGVPVLALTGSNLSGSSFGILTQAGSTNADYSMRCASNSGSVQFLEVYGDGGVTIGLAATKDMGAGTLNVQNGIYVGGAPVTPTRDMIPEDPYWEDAIGVPSNPNITAQSITVFGQASGCVTLFAASGTTGFRVVGATGQFASVALKSGQTGLRSFELISGNTADCFDVFDDTLGASRLQINATSNSITGYGPTAGALVDMTPDSGSFTATGVGFTTSPTVTVQWRRVGNLVALTIPQLVAISNSTSFTLTGLPSVIQATRSQFVSLPKTSMLDNNTVGGAVAGTAFDLFITGASGTLTFYLNTNANGWTSAGSPNKGIESTLTVFYMLN